ncbi:unnamed protein product [Cunninghamella blakesleeana]
MEQNKQIQRPASTQRSLSTLTIDTLAAQNTFSPQLRRNKSVAQPRPRSVYSAEPVMSSDELNAKIADSFQQFCSMLNQMQKTTPNNNAKPTSIKAANTNNKTQQSSYHSPPVLSPISMTTTPSTTSTVTTASTSSTTSSSSNNNNNSNNNNSNDTASNTRRHSSFLPLDNLRLSSLSALSTSPLMNNNNINNKDQLKKEKKKEKVVIHKKKKPIVVIHDKDLVKRFLTAASNGKLNIIKDLFQSCKDLIYAMDEDDGTTALIYATCFGHIETVQYLLQCGAPIDDQDNFGWTALMWATVNNHNDIVNLLLSQNAKTELQTITGNSVFDFILKDDNNMADLLKDASKYSKKYIITTERIATKRKKQKNRLSSSDLNFKAARRQSTPVIATTTRTVTSPVSTPKRSTFQHSGMDAYTHFMTAESDRHRLLTQRHELFYDLVSNNINNTGNNNNSERRGQSIDGGLRFDDTSDNKNNKWMHGYNNHIDNDGNHQGDNINDIEDEEDEDEASQIAKFEASLRSTNIFIWDKCLVDQMFVFSLDNLQIILDTALDFKTLPKPINSNDENMWIPANILFLCARFTYYYSYRGTVDQFFHITFNKLTQLVKQSAKDGQQLCFWMTNVYQLLIYLRKDPGLHGATKEHQKKLADVFIEIYMLFIKDCEKRFDKLIEPGLLDFEPIQGLPTVDFVDSSEWSKFFQRRNSVRLSMDGDSNFTSNSNNESNGPQLIISTLTQIKKLLLTVYDIPEWITKQITSQCFYYVLSETFNRILMNKKYICRSKALQIKLNLSVLEEWSQHQNQKFDDLLHDSDNESKNICVDRLTQLLQLLQCLSGLNNVDVFTSTCQGFHLLNALQIKKCVVNYRYEVQESQLPKYLEEWVIQRASISNNTITETSSSKTRSSSIEEIRKSFSSSTVTTTTTTTNITHPLENSNLIQLNLLLNGKLQQQQQQPIDKIEYTYYYNNNVEYIDSKWIIPFYQQKQNSSDEFNLEGLWEKNGSSEIMYKEIKQKAEREKKGMTTRIPILPYKLVDKLDKKLHK